MVWREKKKIGGQNKGIRRNRTELGGEIREFGQENRGRREKMEGDRGEDKKEYRGNREQKRGRRGGKHGGTSIGGGSRGWSACAGSLGGRSCGGESMLSGRKIERLRRKWREEDRETRKNNIVIKGWNPVGKEVSRELKEWIKLN